MKGSSSTSCASVNAIIAGVSPPASVSRRASNSASPWESAQAPLLIKLFNGARVEPIWRLLATRVETLGFSAQSPATTDDPAICIVADGQRFRPTVRIGNRYTFVIPRLRGEARLVSRSVVPSDLKPWVEDRRSLGVMVRQITTRSGALHSNIAVDDPKLTDGWWSVEWDDIAPWRWTNGNAVLPISGDLEMIDITIGGPFQYPITRHETLSLSED